MRPLEVALHGVTLTLTVAVAAGLWSMSRERPQPPAAPSAEPYAPRPEPELERLRSEVASLRLEVMELRTRPGAAPAAAPVVEAPAAPEPAAPAASLQDQVKALVAAQLKAEREEESRRREDLWRRGEDEFAQRHFDSLAKEVGLDEAQKSAVGKLFEEVRKESRAIRDQVRDKTLPADQAKPRLEQAYQNADLRLQGLVNADQYAQLKKRLDPIREWSIRSAEGGDGWRSHGPPR